jgi:hypothetical protein
MQWVEKFFGKMQEDQNKNESSDLEDNLPMVTYIMLHRIYDLLSLISNKIVGNEDTEKMIKYHEEGYLLGPVPSFKPSEENN